MSGNGEKKAFIRQLNFGLAALSDPKMAAAASPRGEAADLESIADPSSPIQHALPLLATPVSTVPPHATSPASTESLISHTMADMLNTPMLQSPLSHAGFQMPSPIPQPSQTDMARLLNCFSDMLAAGLTQTAAQITSSIKADLQNIGVRMDAIEQAVDNTAARTNQNTNCIQSLQDQLEIALSKLDDLENRSRRYNFRIRGIPEGVVNIPDAVKSFIKNVIPDIPDHKLELDRAHRALQPPRQDGLPRDVVVKPHYYSVKEEVMKRTRNRDDLIIQGNKLQIFADISPTTIQKRRSLKPLLGVLLQKSIKYRWSFPFRLQFDFRDKSYGFSSFRDGEQLLLRLGLITQELPPQESPIRPGSSKRPPTGSPIAPLWIKQQPKRSRDSRPPR